MREPRGPRTATGERPWAFGRPISDDSSLDGHWNNNGTDKNDRVPLSLSSVCVADSRPIQGPAEGRTRVTANWPHRRLSGSTTGPGVQGSRDRVPWDLGPGFCYQQSCESDTGQPGPEPRPGSRERASEGGPRGGWAIDSRYYYNCVDSAILRLAYSDWWPGGNGRRTRSRSHKCSSSPWKFRIL